eukprot:5580085-Alexandrium_andersonii.AAC.1
MAQGTPRRRGIGQAWLLRTKFAAAWAKSLPATSAQRVPCGRCRSQPWSRRGMQRGWAAKATT